MVNEEDGGTLILNPSPGRSSTAKGEGRKGRCDRKLQTFFGCVLLWSGWRGFGAGGVDWWLECRRTGCHRESVTSNKLDGRLLRGTYEL